MNGLKYSLGVKTLCYTLAPILLVMMIAGIFSIFYVVEEPDTLTTSTFEETTMFGDLYTGKVYNIYYNYEGAIYTDEYESIEGIYESEQDANSNEDIYYSYAIYFHNYMKYIVETPEGYIHTNILDLTKDNLEEAKNNIMKEKYHWVKNEDGISSTIQMSELDYYDYSNQKIKNSENKFYTYLDYHEGNSYYCIQQLMYKIAKETFKGIVVYLPLGIIGLIAVCVYLVSSVGHKPGKEGIYLNAFDKLPLELATAIVGLGYVITIFLACGLINTVSNVTSQFVMIIIGLIPIYLVTIWAFETILRRIKSHTFWENSICYIILKKIIEIFKNIKITLKVVIAYFLFGLLTTMLILNRYNSLSILLLIAMWMACGIYILNRVIEYKKISSLIQKLYEGVEVEPLNEEEFKGEFRNLVPKLNDISSGFTNAIEKGIQSERLKTELITNVSHDIKTPLTSIINYVDLMKKEKIENEKVNEYLEVLDKKSARLKKLTEDLVEASKASSGNIKLNKENLAIKELILQELGEFDEKFKEKGLQIIENLPENEMMLNADGKCMSRILDNIFSNISKYALPNSRVYIDATVEEKMEISFKNISANQLNITAEELMERFVRGDVARTTEGSGLGLSIARSLTELQGGNFEIYLDGDLFKVVIRF